MLQNTFFEAGVRQNQHPPAPSTSPELQSYDHRFLEELGTSELLVRGFIKTPLFLGAEVGGPG